MKTAYTMCVVFATVFITACSSKHEFRPTEWKHSKDSLSRKLIDIINAEPFIQIYTPFRHSNDVHRNDVYRIIFLDSLYLDVSGGTIYPPSDEDRQMLKKIAKMKYGGDEKKMLKMLKNKFDLLLDSHIWGTCYTYEGKVLKVHTGYFDSSYQQLKNADTNYHEPYYADSIPSGLGRDSFLIGFFFFKAKPSADEIGTLKNRPHFLWDIDSACYYFRYVR